MKTNSAPKEVWDAAVRIVGFDEMESLAYKVAGRKTIMSEPDFMDLTEKVAQELHDVGQVCQPISPASAALSVFSACILFGSDGSEVEKIAQPTHPYRNDMYIYGLEALFIADDDCVICKLLLHDSNGSGAGANNVGIILLYDNGDAGFHAVPYVIDEDGTFFHDFESITGLSHWLAYLWRGIQYRMSNRPELIKIKNDYSRNEMAGKRNQKTDGGNRIAKVQRIITIVTDEDDPVTIEHNKHQITLSVWGVAGHWRTYQCGKRIWIKPYKKGRERNNPALYCPKEYRFTEE
ncbi:hypothetical protein ACLIBG_00780 [Virgibacillus sp. W0181]|uniref:hypothetical protein n=1 Tax=Virgibacillus sp. W0181 TaxID=3391581 RepID=UPI003F44E4C0